MTAPFHHSLCIGIAIKQGLVLLALVLLQPCGLAMAEEAVKEGAPLDVSEWQYRKPVTFDQTGVIRLELDSEVLAHAARDQADVRVMQEGRQLPYLVERTLPLRELDLSFKDEPDAERPAFSRWRIALPVAGHPLEALEVASPTPLFNRHVKVWEESRDGHGDIRWRMLGSATWARKPDVSTPLRVSLDSRPSRDAVFLETDNGDNPHLQIATVRASFRPVHLVFTTTDSAAVELAYGNPEAPAPRYDIELIRAQLQNADQTNASLGPETRAKGYKHGRDSFLSGGTWLWIALILVVAGLLWLVAKLLPSAQPPPQGDS
jgi:hypothetical protein